MIVTASARRTSRGWQYAEPPRFTPDVTYSLPVGGQSHNPNTSAELNTLLTGGTLDGKTLARGDVVTLDAGTTYTPTGNTFTIPALGGSGWVYVISSALGSLPAAGVRVAPSDATNMPKILAKSSAEGYPAILTATAAKYFRFVGIQFTASSANYTYSVCQVGNDEAADADLPSYITFDRCLIRGDATLGGSRGILFNGKYLAAVNCYVDGFKDTGVDTQAIAWYNTPGPLLIQNNFLEGAGENLISGGADPSASDRIPSDITIRGNHIYKRTAWKYAGLVVKNQLELKIAKRVLIERNYFENFWEEDQSHAINISVINQSGSFTNATVEDVTIRHNKWNHLGNWITTCYKNCPGYENPSLNGRRLHVHDNLVLDLNRADWGGYAQPIRIGSLPESVYVFHNTCIFGGADTSQNALEATGAAGSGVQVKNNIFWNGIYGLLGDGQGSGSTALEYYWDNWSVTGNVLVGGSASGNPSGNFYPANEAAVGFVGGGDYTLSGGSSYKNAGTDGSDIGCTNVALIETYATAAINGTAN